jgi:diamine N-acetyltransferase
MLSLKPATPEDLASIAKLAREIWAIHYIPIIGIGQVNYMLNKMYSLAALNKQVEEGQIFHMVEIDGKQVGFISVSKKGEGEYFLHKFYILDQKQNAGLGTEVFKKLFEELYKPNTIRLTVNRQNFKSINFYFKMGFRIEKVEDFDIGNDYYMNDFVMLWKKN